jgi:heme/copper-type cytochrome/quinol oxidase subunit 2
MTKFFMLYMMTMTGITVGVMFMSLYFQYQLYRDTFPRHNRKRVKRFFNKLMKPFKWLYRMVRG